MIRLRNVWMVVKYGLDFWFGLNVGIKCLNFWNEYGKNVSLV